jgi:hypothetical protein
MRLKLRRARRRDAPRHRRLGAGEIRPVKHQHVEVNVQLERRAEAQARRHRSQGSSRLIVFDEQAILQFSQSVQHDLRELAMLVADVCLHAEEKNQYSD